MNKKKRNIPSSGIVLDGFYRVNIVEDGKVKGDSGWVHNLIPNAGLTGYITYKFASSAGSSWISYMHLGSSQSALASSASILPGEYNKASAASIASTQVTTRASSTSGDTVRFLATFVSNSLFTDTATVACIGLYNTTGANSIFCGGSFASSTLGSAQAINCTYDIVFTASTS